METSNPERVLLDLRVLESSSATFQSISVLERPRKFMRQRGSVSSSNNILTPALLIGLPVKTREITGLWRQKSTISRTPFAEILQDLKFKCFTSKFIRFRAESIGSKSISNKGSDVI